MISAMQNSEHHTRLQHDLMIDRWEKWYANNNDDNDEEQQEEAQDDNY